jgi:hypothetical protein
MAISQQQRPAAPVPSGGTAARAFDERWLIVVAALLVAVPVIAGLVHAFEAQYIVNGDQAVVASRAIDVLTSRMPLVGQFSTTTFIVGEPTYHPGPLLFWLLALPARVDWSGALLLTAATVNVAAAVGVLLLARRRGGNVLMAATGAGLVLALGSTRSDVVYEIWNPAAPVVPFTLLIYLCWSVACGELRLLPLAVLVASFTIHCHLAYVIPSALLLAVGVLGLVVEHRRAARDGRKPMRRRQRRRWWLAAGIVGLVCWSGPLLDQGLVLAGSEGEHGNLDRLLDAAGAGEETLGSDAGARSVAQTLGVLPWWLQRPQTTLGRVADVVSDPSPATWVTAAAVLVALVALLVAGGRRRRADVVAACALSLVLCLAVFLLTSSYPKQSDRLPSYAYTSWWAASAGMFAWMTVGWSAVTLFGPARLRGRGRWGATLPAVGLVAMAAAVVLVVARPPYRADERWYEPVRTVLDRLYAELPPTESVRVDGQIVLELQAAVMYDLRRRGVEVSAPPEVAIQFGPDYQHHLRPFEWVITIVGGTVAPDRSRPIARVRVGPPAPETYTVALRRVTDAFP